MMTFFSVPQVEPPHNTTQASIVVSTFHATVETTSSYDDSLARKPRSCLMPAVTVASVNMAIKYQTQISRQTVVVPVGNYCIRVVKWSLKNNHVSVSAKCNYMMVGLIC
jgi:hypothetical protein